MDAIQPDGRKLVKVDLLDGRLRLSSPFTTFLQVKKVPTNGTAGDQGGFAKLGFIDGQRASTAPTPDNGILGADAVFDIRFGAASHHIVVSKASTLDNSKPQDLVDDINAVFHDVDGPAHADIHNQVEAKLISANTSGIMLATKLNFIKMIQIADANDSTEVNLGFQDKQIAGEIAVAGSNELRTQGTGIAPADGKIAADEVVLRFKINNDPHLIVVHLLKHEDPEGTPNRNTSNTDDNHDINDLVADLNLAIAHEKLPDGRSLGAAWPPAQSTPITTPAPAPMMSPSSPIPSSSAAPRISAPSSSSPVPTAARLVIPAQPASPPFTLAPTRPPAACPPAARLSLSASATRRRLKSMFLPSITAALSITSPPWLPISRPPSTPRD